MIRKYLLFLLLFSALLVIPRAAVITPYGFFRTTLAMDSNNSSHGKFILWVPPGDLEGRTSFDVTFSRFGLKVTEKTGDWDVLGVMELDFFGGGPANKAHPRMRHAFFKFTSGNTSLLAGQYWDIVSPRFPTTLNTTVNWGAGNTGFRRAQLRITQLMTLSQATVQLDLGLFKTIAEDLDGDGINDGDREILPTLQGRAGLVVKNENVVLDAGVAGLFGRSSTGEEDSEVYTTAGLFGDFSLAVSPFALTAEFYTGQYLNGYFGGILQGFNPLRDEPVKSTGGYVSLRFDILERVSFNGGFSFDHPDKATLSPGYRSHVSVIHTNLICRLTERLTAGFQVGFWSTSYQDMEDFTNTRFTLDLKYVFSE